MRVLATMCKWILAAVIAGIGMPASAAIELPLTRVFSGSPPSDGTIPWLTATFTEESGGTVLFTFNTLHLTNPENVKDFYFNFNDSLNVQNLGFQLVSGGSYTLPGI